MPRPLHSTASTSQLHRGVTQDSCGSSITGTPSMVAPSLTDWVVTGSSGAHALRNELCNHFRRSLRGASVRRRPLARRRRVMVADLEGRLTAGVRDGAQRRHGIGARHPRTPPTGRWRARSVATQ